jgi:hypothetical protein
MGATRIAAFRPGIDEQAWARQLVERQAALLARWASEDPASPRLALRATFDEPVGQLTVAGSASAVEAGDVVAVVARDPAALRAGDGVDVLAAFPETTPSWSLAATAGRDGEAPGCPFPALQQLALCWLGQGWDASGARSLGEALLTWRAADGSSLPQRVAGEVARLRLGAAGDEPELAGTLADLGVAVPYTDPVFVLDRIVEACA